MKNYVMLFASTLLMFGACEKSQSVKEPDAMSVVRFNLTGTTKPYTTKAQAPLSEEASKLYYNCMAGDEWRKEKNSVVGDAGYGVVSDTLEMGEYRFSFVGHNSAESYVDETRTKIWFDRVSDSFYATKQIHVTQGGSATENVVLDRCVSKITIVATDPIPAGVAKMKLTAGSIADTLIISTGMGVVRTSPYIREFSFTAVNIGQANTSFSIYTFLPSDTHTVTLKAEALSATGEVVYQYDFGSISVIKNHIIRYSGKLFRSMNQEMSLKVETDWADTIDVAF